jgi:hypothetical protein
MGLEQRILAGTGPPGPLQGLSLYSFLQSAVNRGFFGSIQGVIDPSNRRDFYANASVRIEIVEIGVYSAAVANVGFGFAADNMKSEMRGTISDLKREPLNTP